MSKKIILVGNPNTGKSTLFNTLTKSNEKVSNWHGVTVGVKYKRINFENKEFEVADTPGVYSFDAYSNEEKITIDYLIKNKNSVIVNVCDANNLKRNLILTLDLIKQGFKIVLAVNMYNEVCNFDYNMLSKLLGIKILKIDARKTKDVFQLMKFCTNNNFEKTQNNAKINEKTQNNININDIFAKITINQDANNYRQTDKIDKFVLNKFNFIIIFLLSLFLIFYITFGPVGMLFSSIISTIFNQIVSILQKIILCTNMSYIIKSLIIDGVFVAVSSIVSFIPQILLLMFFINVLEDIGFMSRVAFMFDGLLKKIGLSGKSLFSLMMGYGCTTSAIITTRNLENTKLRKRTVLLLPFMSCSAKLPIYLVISSLFFEKYKYIFVLVLYLFSILISILFALIYKKKICDADSTFILEMPKYRKLNFKKVMKDVWFTLKEFIVKVGTLIIFFSMCVWFLKNFSTSFKFLNGENFDKSILYYFCDKISFLFKPLGMANTGIVVSLLLGVVAKEMIVVGLAMMNGVAGGMIELTASLTSVSAVCSFSWVSSIVFLIFILLYSPCISAIVAVKNELGTKMAIYVFAVQFLIAYLVSFIIYKTLLNFNFIFVILIFLILDICIVYMLKSKKKKNKCWENCNACRRI